MDLRRLLERRFLVPYVAATWVAILILGATHALTLSLDGPDETLVRVGGALVAVLAAALVWIAISEPIRLRDRVAEATERIEAYAHELEQSNRDLEQYASVAAHDLRSPLHTISGYISIARDVLREDPEEAEDLLEQAEQAAHRMDALIDGLQAYSRVGTGETRREAVALDTVLEGVLADLAMAVQEEGARIEHGNLPVVEGDPTQLRQLLQNLISNALQYNDADTPHVEIHAAPEDDHWRITVEDNGPGIPESERDDVFEIFHRVDDRPSPDGTGIGLAVCKRIVERHGGKITVDDGPGRGARFTFTLPGAAPEAGQTRPEDVASPPELQAGRAGG